MEDHELKVILSSMMDLRAAQANLSLFLKKTSIKPTKKQTSHIELAQG